MLVYILTFLCSVFLFWLSQNVKQKQKRWVLLVALIIPCVIAGIRDVSIGVDVTSYASKIFECACKSNSFGDYLDSTYEYNWTMVNVGSMELGYTLFVYIIAKVFGNIAVLLFFTELIIILPVIYGLRKENGNTYLWLSMMIYYFMFYNNSLNVMRQSISASLIFLAIQFLREERIKTSIAWVIVACFFHKSAFLGFICIFAYCYLKPSLKKDSNKLKQKTKRLLIIIAIGVFALMISNFFEPILVALGLERYSLYVSGRIQFMPNQLITRLPVLFVIWYMRKELYKQGVNTLFFIAMVIFDIFAGQFASVSVYSVRIGMYFSIFSISALAQSCIAIDRRLSTKRLVCFGIVIAYILSYWWYYFVFNNNGFTIPYVFAF